MPYQAPITITPGMLTDVAEIAELLGRFESAPGGGLAPRLRRDNRIRTIQASLAIENNTLTVDQVTAILDGKRVLGLPREIQEVKNASKSYEALTEWCPESIDDLLRAHSLLMSKIADDAGKFRNSGVGVYRGEQLVHMAPAADRVEHLVRDLFLWLGKTDLHPLIAAAVTHYELEFIHPFSDGNGRIGRLWQTLVLSRWKPSLGYLPVESLIRDHQTHYYEALGRSDAAGEATPFVEFMLPTMRQALADAIAETSRTDPVDDPVTDQVEHLLSAMASGEECTRETLMVRLGLQHRPTFRANYLRPALAAGWVEMTQPRSPNSPTQRYRLTARGRARASEESG